METEGDVPGKKSKSKEESRDFIDFPCYVCHEKGIRKESVKYCIMCENYCCDECVKLHDIIPTLAHHVLVDSKDDTDVSGSKELPSVPTERCPLHPLKLIDMFCQTHDKVGCATCISTEHDKSCKLLYIPDSIDVLFDFEKIEQKEQQLKLLIEEALDFKGKCLVDLLNLIKDAKGKVEKYTEKVIDRIAELKQKTEAKLDLLRRQLEESFAHQTSSLDKDLNIAESVYKKLKLAVSKGKHKSQQIVCSYKASEIAETFQGTVKRLSYPSLSTIIFEPYATTEELFRNLSAKSSFGEFIQKPLQKIKTKEIVPIKLPSDKFKSLIRGSCIVSNNSVLLADRNNSLKRLSLKEKIISKYLRLPGRPFSVCFINDKEAALTVTGNRKVYMVAIGANKMGVKRTLELKFDCRGIAYRDGVLFVSDRTTVYIITLQGEEKRQISSDMSGNLFSNINNIAVSGSGHLLLVADGDKGLVAVNIQTSQKMWDYTDDDLKRATGVCHDGKGNIFVCGWVSHNVLQITESGARVGEIVKKADGLMHPWALCFASSSSTLFVSQDGDASENILSFNLKTL